jgi:hypothetical protein
MLTTAESARGERVQLSAPRTVGGSGKDVYVLPSPYTSWSASIQ